MDNPIPLAYVPTPFELERVGNDFKYHKPHSVSQTARYEHIRGMLGEVAADLLAMCPPSRERSLVLTKLEEAMFWANASIARNEKPITLENPNG